MDLDPPRGPDDIPGDAVSAPRANRAALFVLAFGSGFGVMVIEIAGGRLMAPVFGLSAVPWTAIIGVVLTALAVGNHLGGRLADAGRVPLAAILAFAGATALIPLVLGWVPELASRSLGFIGGAVVSAGVLFALPVLALGTVVPYLVRAATSSLDDVGRRAGDVSAAATLGSILGTFLTGFVLLPAFPLPVVMAGTAGGLLLLAALARWLLGRGPGAGALLASSALVLALGVGMGPADAGVLHAEQTLHGSIQVTEREWASGTVREMWQNAGSSSAEYVGGGEPAHPYAVVSLELLEPLLPRVERALVLGGAALTLPVALARRSPGTAVEVVELDPAATRLAREYFAFGRVEDELDVSVVHGDARRFLRDAPADSYDLVYLDVFDHLVSVPWTMVTVEALELMEAALTPDGLLVANVLSPVGGPGAEFLRRLLATFEVAFPVVRAHPLGTGDVDPGVTRNVLVIAGRRASALPEPRGDGTGAEGPDAPDAPVMEAGGEPFVDAWAPVEYLQARVFWEGLRWR